MVLKLAGELLREMNFLQLGQWVLEKINWDIKGKWTLICRTQTNKAGDLLVTLVTSNLSSWPALDAVDHQTS